MSSEQRQEPGAHASTDGYQVRQSAPLRQRYTKRSEEQLQRGRVYKQKELEREARKQQRLLECQCQCGCHNPQPPKHEPLPHVLRPYFYELYPETATRITMFSLNNDMYDEIFNRLMDFAEANGIETADDYEEA